MGVIDDCLSQDGSVHQLVAVQHTIQSFIHLLDTFPHGLQLPLQLRTAQVAILVPVILLHAS